MWKTIKIKHEVQWELYQIYKRVNEAGYKINIKALIKIDAQYKHEVIKCDYK